MERKRNLCCTVIMEIYSAMGMMNLQLYSIDESHKHKRIHNYGLMYKTHKQVKLIYVVRSKDYGYHYRGRKWEGITSGEFWNLHNGLS